MIASKTLAYATWAFSNIYKIAKDYTGKSIDWVASRKRFDVEVTLQGVIMESRMGLTSTEIIGLLDTMSHFGNVQIHITNTGGSDENINRKAENREQSEVHTKPKNSSNGEHDKKDNEDTVHSY
tara:strand:+ start:399 stop:770 length:372 start_codon:yes stop_codon:yes gene_type:complete